MATTHAPFLLRLKPGISSGQDNVPPLPHTGCERGTKFGPRNLSTIVPKPEEVKGGGAALPALPHQERGPVAAAGALAQSGRGCLGGEQQEEGPGRPDDGSYRPVYKGRPPLVCVSHASMMFKPLVLFVDVCSAIKS